MRVTVTSIILALGFSSAQLKAENFQLSGKVEGQFTVFSERGQFHGQDYRSNLSLVTAPELYWEWDQGDSNIIFKPFLRLDQRDGERTHGDIRELLWTRVDDNWELKAGLGKVFWGVTEFQHLVDTINQTDGVDSVDGEEKLGQPMINLSLVRDWGIIDAFVLPGFREQTFPGQKGRLRSGLIVDTDTARYESSAKERHVDLALRWSHSVDVFDLGLYWFKGTNREPVLQLDSDLANGPLVPFYQQMTQVGLDGQATIDSWLWKFEGLVRDTRSERYSAAQAGFEYTFYGVMDSFADLGLLLEYGWDERGENSGAAIQNDLFLGGRITLNDTASSALLVGIGYDNDDHSQSLSFESSRRISSEWTLALEGQYYNSKNQGDSLAQWTKDSHIQFSLARYF